SDKRWKQWSMAVHWGSRIIRSWVFHICMCIRVTRQRCSEQWLWALMSISDARSILLRGFRLSVLLLDWHYLLSRI
ncbi:hypothetical protein H4R99_005896, partial [Coemansia sp. RSA 1722]